MALIPKETLAKADKIAFVTRLAMGDFAYLQQFFKAFAKRYPHIAIHLWVDDTRTSWRFWRWKRERQDALYDWLAACPFLARVWRQNESLGGFFSRLRKGKAERYPIVVSLSTVRPWYYARMTGWIGPEAFRAATHKRSRRFDFVKRLGYGTLDAKLTFKHAGPGRHITDAYADRFEALFDVTLAPEERLPTIEIPPAFLEEAKARVAPAAGGKVIFVNPYSKGIPRSWTLPQVGELIDLVKKGGRFGDPLFVVNAPPEKRAEIEALASPKIVPFTAKKNFFELPAIMAQADAIVSVDTATTHLANAVKVPLVALMRHNNPEWAPLDRAHTVILKPATREQWVKDIPPSEVAAALERLAG